MSKQQGQLFWKTIIPACLAVAVLTLYLVTLCPSVYLIDSGELASISHTLGIAHPTGYPLYTILSYMCSRLPGEPIVNVNIFSAFISVIAALFVYAIAFRVMRDRIAALFPAFIFALAPTIWRMAITNEVYPLTALFAVIILFVLLRIGDTRDVFLLLYCIGLSFTNHIIIFSLAVPVIVYLIVTYRPRLHYIVYGCLVVTLGVSFYLYLIARTKGGALLTWGGVYNIERLIWHITGKQYQVWMFTLTFKEIMNNFINGIGLLARSFMYIFLVPVIAGFIHLYRLKKRLFWLFVSIIAVNLLYAVNYSIPDIESYYIPAFCTMIVTAIYGFTAVQRYMKWFVVVPISVLVMIINHNACSLRKNTFAYDFSLAHIESLPANSLVLCTFWDIYSPTLYFQYVEQKRPDLVIIDKELLRRTWYINYLERAYPHFFDTVRPAIEAYLPDLHKFEYGEPYNPQVIQAKFVHMLQTFIHGYTSNNVYLAMPYPDNDLSQVKTEHTLVPYGFVIQVIEDTSKYQPFDFTTLNIYFPKNAYDERLIHNRDLVNRMVQGNVNYLMQRGDTTTAIQTQQWFNDWIR
jgi:hypothetical protein